MSDRVRGRAQSRREWRVIVESMEMTNTMLLFGLLFLVTLYVIYEQKHELQSMIVRIENILILEANR